MLFRHLQQGSDRPLPLIRASLSAIALSTLLLIGSSTQPVSANTNQMMVEMPLRTDADVQKALRQAELLVSEILEQRFSEDTTLSEFKVVILGNRDGAIVPMLTTAVSRDQWSTNPQVGLWTTYNSSFAALVYPSQSPQVVAARAPQPQTSRSQTSQRSRRPQTSRRSVARLPERSVVLIERAYDEGRLNPQQLNDFVDLLD